MLRVVISELLSRGLLWVRVLLIGAVLASEEYGYLLLLISAVTIFGTVISYPQIKRILTEHRCGRAHFYSTTALYLFLLPFISVASYWYFDDVGPVVVIGLSVFFAASGQTFLYVLRVKSIAVYNKAKVYAAVFSTFVFFTTLPFEQDLLPLTYLSYLGVLAAFFLRGEGAESRGEKFLIRSVVSDWVVFGAQSLLTQVGQQGNRFIVGAVLSVADVAVFVKSYMLASGITFIYAAVMIKYEKGLTKAVESEDIAPRVRKAALLGVGMLVLLSAYIAAIFGFWFFNLDFLTPVFRDAEKSLVLLFSGFFALQAIYLVMNPVVIAAGNRYLSLFATNLSLVIQVVVIVFFWGELSLEILAASMIAGQLGLVSVLVVSNIRCKSTLR